MDARRHLLDALGYGTPEKPMPDPIPTLTELVRAACANAVAREKAIRSIKQELRDLDDTTSDADGGTN